MTKPSNDEPPLTNVRDLEAMLPLEEEDLTADSQDLEYTAVAHRQQFSTDLVRLYLQDIGRIPLLKRDEEVHIAQQVQSYLRLVEIQNRAAESDAAIDQYQTAIAVHDQLLVQLGHRPSYERWAKILGQTVATLKQTLKSGKKRWAELAGLTVEELENIEKQGITAKAHMIKANLRLVVSVAKKYQNRGLELLDLIQEGTLGLERAVEKFDPTKGYRFSTYSYWWIRQGITRAIATQSRMIRLPVHITEKLNKIKRAQRKISQEKGHTPKIDEVAEELGMTPEQVREVLTQVPRSVSLELKVGQDKDTELMDLLETDTQSPEDELMREALQNDMQEILLDLTPREQEVIALRFGFQDGVAHSLSEIGRILNLSRERVRQIEAKALQKLRHPRRRDRIRDYYENLG
ncbi:RNA polymerase sigma factor [Synechocystis sp. PCC 6803]|uniref:Probable RNA polymerase sigma-C factor n=1 Tax=Synechocystis sp. (strain ATCC 27184 / PCC 6803 / Kazusa) TaxID=1111708 RepID=RPSC_SYNY3|nr:MULTISPECIES: RNA polymerase sigma factor SigC [unclassified Synechocystis]Q59996.1 RecName: Full=Probable RNA polymerase sigma-C factor [Synechocystis sp. PCC 6803 substr. Kazusa]AGF52711.1 RNA polymerase sigma factor [Synechocystis sp. PCC 6803]ALJ68629.1 RNA polymerase subunit sigma [Synechocystis sp. PCC 6803]AVP90478.1 RNA polymerase sigma-C factor [Synechocystis sp. IPPAS B-1465]MBD2616777.1 RNA polymerase sigma factor SigC [Synechocystis sp. FACHB-898]MBD2638091.1 RNA polymerase sig